MLWTPKRLSPYGWWRADIADVVSGKVAALPDQSGNGHHLVQTNDALRPQYVLNVAGRKNQPCVQSTSAGQLLTAAGVTLPRECAIWVVTGSVTSGGFAMTHLVGSNRTHYLYLPGVAGFNVTNAAGSLYFARFSTWVTASRSLLGIYDGAAIDVFSNNVNANGSTTGAPFAPSSLTGTLGLLCSADGVNPSLMQVFEAAVFPAAMLSAVNRGLLHTYQSARYQP